MAAGRAHKVGRGIRHRRSALDRRLAKSVAHRPATPAPSRRRRAPRGAPTVAAPRAGRHRPGSPRRPRARPPPDRAHRCRRTGPDSDIRPAAGRAS
jgi:hypothetical protein